MRKYFLITALFAALAVGASRAAEALPPKPDRYFNDYAGIIKKEAADRFNDQLAQFERDTSNQVVVAIYPKMQSDSDIADYTQRIAQSWEVGQKERNNGVVLFVFPQDRKMFIQTGYGTEGALPDATAFDITEFKIKPRFRDNDYEGGLAAGINSIQEALRGEYVGTGQTVRERARRSDSGFLGNLVLFLFFVALIILISRLTHRRGYYYSRAGSGSDWSFGSGNSGGGWSSGGSSGGFSSGGGSFGGGGAGSSW